MRRAWQRLPPAAALQGAYWLCVGLWPLIHYRSFEAVTGPKVDRWLVRTITALISVVGSTLLLASARGRAVAPEVATLGLGSASALVGSDIYYTARGRIRPTYLLDVVAHVPLFALWARDLSGRRDQRMPGAGPARPVAGGQ